MLLVLIPLLWSILFFVPAEMLHAQQAVETGVNSPPKEHGLFNVLFKDGLLSIVADKADVRAVLKAVADKSGVTFDMGEGVEGVCTVSIENTPFVDGIRKLLGSLGQTDYVTEYVRERIDDTNKFKITQVKILRRALEKNTSTNGRTSTLTNTSPNPELLTEEWKKQVLDDLTKSKGRDKKALWSLYKAGRAATPTIIDVLRMDNVEAKLAAMQIIREWGIKEATPEVISLLKSDNIYLVQGAIVTLGVIGGVDTADILMDVVKNTVNDASVISAIYSLGNIAAPTYAASLKPYLTSTNKYIRMATASSLGKLGSNEGVSLLIGFSYDTDANVQAAAINAMGTSDDPAILSRLKAINDDPMTSANARDVARMVVKAIGYKTIPNEEKEEYLRKEIGNGDLLTQWAVRQLVRIGTSSAIGILKDNYAKMEPRHKDITRFHLVKLGVVLE